MSASESAGGDGKLFILAAICMAALVLPLSFSGGALATPAIGRELGGSAVALTWITNAFMLTFGSLLMAAGALADQFGRKKLFAIGMAGFTLTSLALAFAPTVGWLDALRAVQGVAAAAALASGSAALAQEFEGHALTRAFSMLGTTFGIGLAFGPLAAGLLIDAFGWRSIFLTTAAIGVVALVFGIPRMRETRDPEAAGLDWPGTITFSSTLALFTFGVIQAPESGWGSALIVGILGLSALLLAAFIIIEKRVKRPMLDLSLFRYFRFVGVQLLPIGTCFCYIVLVVILPQRFIGVEGMSEIDAGWLMVALSLPLLVVPALVASMTRWVSAGVLSGIGFVIAAIGLQWLGAAGGGGIELFLVLPMLMIGIGAGMPWGLMDGLAVSVVPKDRAGMATGIFNTARVAGEGVTLAIVSAILASLAHGVLSKTVDGASASQISQAAQRIATSDIANAAAILPDVGRQMLVSAYADSFQVLIHILTVVTVLAAAAALGLLGKTPKA
jgi:MFS family permease